jgi:hypothetical protein
MEIIRARDNVEAILTFMKMFARNFRPFALSTLKYTMTPMTKIIVDCLVKLVKL